MSDTGIEAVEELFDYLLDETPYYDWLNMDVEHVEPGRVVTSIPYSQKVETPDVTPTAMNGGVIATVIDNTALGAVLAHEREVMPLATLACSDSVGRGRL